jgi:hypothetical protein
METAILTLLEQNQSLGFEQIALYLDEPPEQVRSASRHCAGAVSSTFSASARSSVTRRRLSPTGG